MHKGLILSVGAALSMALTATAQAQFVIPVDSDSDGTPVSYTFFQDTHDAILSISWDLNHEAFSPSWGSELAMDLLHVDSGTVVTFGTGGVDIDFGWANAPGLYASAGTMTAAELGIAIEDTYGDWVLTVFETYDDAIVPDGHIDGTITINKVPAPGVIALLGTAGLVSLRRRRRA